MGQKIKQSLEDQLHALFPDTDKTRDVNVSEPKSDNEAVQNSEEDTSEARRRERRASNDTTEDNTGEDVNFSNEQRNELFEKEKSRLESERKRNDEEARHLKGERFLFRSIGIAISGVALSAFAVVAHGLLSDNGKGNKR